MLKNTLINRIATKKIAKALQSIEEKVVFVGGAIVSLYINDPAAEDIRPTKDIDVTFNIVTPNELETLRQKLINIGFIQSAEEDVICRFRFEDIKVDVLSTVAVGWAPSNKWFQPGFEKAKPYSIDEFEIHILPLPYFLATKLEAFFDRGIKDIYNSHDLEDIVYLFNYTVDIVQQIEASDMEIRTYLSNRFKEIKADRKIINAMPGSLYHAQMEEQMELILEKMEGIINGI